MDLSNLQGTQLGKYTLRELIGKGGMSAVYRAHQTNLNRDVAIKVLSPTLATDTSYAQRFTLEAKTAASLEHNNIIPVYDYGTQGEISYIAMRLLTGGTLGERMQHRLDRQQALPTFHEALTLSEEMVKALGYAHSQNVIHRDIKASNIMFDGQGDPYVVDFGISRVLHTNVALTAENTTIGTPTYMAPEQWRDEPLTAAVDQYALGVLMYFVLTGRLPFYANTPLQLMNKHLNNIPTPPHELRSGLPPKVSEVLLRAMAKAPDERYASVRSFGESFGAALRDVPRETTNFFTFVLIGSGSTPSPPADTPPPASDPKVNNAPTAIPPAAPTVANIPAATVQNPNTPDNVPVVEAPRTAPPSQPPSPPSSQNARQVNPLMVGGGIGLALAVGIGVVLIVGVIMVSNLLNPPAPTTAPNETADPSSEAVIGGISINPTNLPAATAITLEGPGAGSGSQVEVNVTGGSTLFSNGSIVVRTVAITPLGVVVSGHADGRIRMWTSGTSGTPVVLQQHNGVINDIEISADGRVMVSGGDDRTVRVWDAQSASYRGLLGGHTGAVRGVAINPDGTLAASASEDGTVRLWDVNGGAQITTLHNGADRVFDVAFSTDASLLAAGDNSGVIRIWDVELQTLRHTLRGHTESVRSVVFSPDNTQLVSSSTDNTVRIWDVVGATAIHVMEGHNNDVWRVGISRDGQIVASGGRDNNLRLWDAASGSAIANLTGHSGWVLGVAFSPDNQVIITGSGDGSVRTWQVAN